MAGPGADANVDAVFVVPRAVDHQKQLPLDLRLRVRGDDLREGTREDSPDRRIDMLDREELVVLGGLPDGSERPKVPTQDPTIDQPC